MKKEKEEAPRAFRSRFDQAPKVMTSNSAPCSTLAQPRNLTISYSLSFPSSFSVSESTNPTISIPLSAPQQQQQQQGDDEEDLSHLRALEKSLSQARDESNALLTHWKDLTKHLDQEKQQQQQRQHRHDTTATTNKHGKKRNDNDDDGDDDDEQNGWQDDDDE